MYLKISSGKLKGRIFKVPSTDLRPTSEKVRSAFFNTIFSMISFEKRAFLEIFAGSGAFTFEAISRGFETAAAIEKNFKAFSQIKLNCRLLNLEQNTTLINDDAFSFDYDSFKGKKFNAIFLDPPYALGDKTPNLLDKIADSSIVGEVCVIAVEGSSQTLWKKENWSSKYKNFGDSHLSFFYNWS